MSDQTYESKRFGWTIGAQARRVAAVDARSIGIDAAYGFLYVLAGFILPAPNPARAVHIAVVPFIALSFVLCYFAVRICGPEWNDKTAMFYANLPRQREVVYWTRAAWLGAYALSMEAVIATGVAVRLGAARPDQPLVVAPYMFVLPFFVFGYVIWLIHGRLRWFIDVPVVVAVIAGPVWLMIWDVELRDGRNERFTVTLFQNFGPALTLAILAGLLLWHGCRRWRKIQVGELS